MKVLVTTKSAIDYQVKVVVKPDGSGVETDGVQMSMNPFDAIAVEACVSMQEAGIIAKSTVITIDEDDTVLRQAMAMGIQHAVQIQAKANDPYPKAKLLYEYIQNNEFDLILMGKLGIDGDHSQIPSMLAGMLNWPCISNASNIEKSDEKLIVHRETDDGIAILHTPTPCIISCDLRLNTPRFIALPKLLKAKQHDVELITNVTLHKSGHKRLKVETPAIREGNPPTDDLDTFIRQLKEGGVLS